MPIDPHDNLPGSGGGDLAVIGEGTPNRTEISVQVLQNIYHELTGKTEELSKSYDQAFQVQGEDFSQLNYKIRQICEQYNICSSNSNIKIFYVNDTQQTVSSFDKFEHFNVGNTSAVESVLLTYIFMILLPKLRHPQSYSLSIRVASRVVVERKMRDGMPFDMPKIMQILRGRNALVAVKYIDYAVARTIVNTVDEWFGTLKKADPPKLVDYLRKRTHVIPLLSKYLVGAAAVGSVWHWLPTFLPATATLLGFGRTSLLACAGIFAAYKFADHFGSAAENSLDRWSPISFIRLTTGDQREIDAAGVRNRRSVVGGAAKFASALLMAVVTKFLVEFIAQLLSH